MICYEYPPIGGGGSKVVNGLTRELVRQGHQVDLVTMHFKGLPVFEKKDGLNIYRIRCLRLKSNICTPAEMVTYIVSALPFLIKLTQKNKYDINHTHFIYPDGILAYILKKITGVPFIITAHGSDVPGYNPNRFKLLHKLIIPLWKRIVKNSLRVICSSKSLQELVLKIDRNAVIELIPNGINLKKFSQNEEKKKQILVVSRMFERKGVQYFLNAIQELDHGFKVNVVGDGPYLLSLMKQARELKLNVNFHGFIDNKSEALKNLYESSRIFVFTSEAENFPIVLLEAMSAGLAIITTDNSGCAEVVGDTALLVPPKNSTAIRDALLKLVEDPELCKKLGQAARLRVEQEFGLESTTKKHEALYKKVLSVR